MKNLLNHIMRLSVCHFMAALCLWPCENRMFLARHDRYFNRANLSLSVLVRIKVLNFIDSIFTLLVLDLNNSRFEHVPTKTSLVFLRRF